MEQPCARLGTSMQPSACRLHQSSAAQGCTGRPFCSLRNHRPACEHSRHRRACRAVTEEDGTTTEQQADSQAPQQKSKRGKRRAESTDFISSELTRRFGIAGGLAWAGVLAFGVISEQIKTRLEESSDARNTQDVTERREVQTPSGLRYTDFRIGGGPPVQRNYLIVLHFKASVDGRVVEDTRQRDKPVVYLFGGRPFTGGLCQGTEEALSTMRVGGIRQAKVPSSLAFPQGYSFRSTRHADKEGVIPAGSDVVYELEVVRVSIPPS